jgi:hypothetical protein
MQTPNDTQLHELARKRVEFRAHLIVYCVTITSLWIIWYLTGHHYMWPVWPMVGWGIGLMFHYIFDYRQNGILSVEEEYKKLKREQEKRQGATG